MNTLAFLFASGTVIQDTNTKKFTFINTFSAFIIPKTSEFVYQSFVVAGRILDVTHGNNTIEIKIIDQDGQKIASVILSGESKTNDVDIVARFDLVKISKIGKYFLKASLNNVDLEDNNKFYLDCTKDA
jgi:hypothetical protein